MTAPATGSGSPSRRKAQTYLNYEVRHRERYRAILGWQIPTEDASALLKAWKYEGWNVWSVALARRLGAAAVLLKDAADEAALLADMDKAGSTGPP